MFVMRKMALARLMAKRGSVVAELQREQAKPLAEQVPAYVRNLRGQLALLDGQINSRRSVKPVGGSPFED